MLRSIYAATKHIHSQVNSTFCLCHVCRNSLNMPYKTVHWFPKDVQENISLLQPWIQSFVMVLSMPRIMEAHQLRSSFQAILIVAGKFSMARSTLGTPLKTFLLLLLTLILLVSRLHYKKPNADRMPDATDIIFSIMLLSFAGTKSKWHGTLSNIANQQSVSSDIMSGVMPITCWGKGCKCLCERTMSIDANP